MKTRKRSHLSPRFPLPKQIQMRIIKRLFNLVCELQQQNKKSGERSWGSFLKRR